MAVFSERRGGQKGTNTMKITKTTTKEINLLKFHILYVTLISIFHVEYLGNFRSRKTRKTDKLHVKINHCKRNYEKLSRRTF